MNQERVFKVLLGPHVSEKATVLADKKGQFVFKVATDATKLEIKKAVESLFSVKVERVTTLNVLCLLYTSPSPRDQRGSRMPSSA